MDPRSRPGKSSYCRQQTTLGRSSITTTTAGLVREAATSGTRGGTGAITTAPCYSVISRDSTANQPPFRRRRVVAVHRRAVFVLERQQPRDVWHNLYYARV